MPLAQVLSAYTFMYSAMYIAHRVIAKAGAPVWATGHPACRSWDWIAWIVVVWAWIAWVFVVVIEAEGWAWGRLIGSVMDLAFTPTEGWGHIAHI